MKISLYQGFDALPDRYDDLFEAGGRRCFFASRPWFEALVKAGIEPDDQLRLYAAEDADGRPLAFLPMRSPAGQNGSRFADRGLGERSLASLTNFQSCAFAPLLAEDGGVEALKALLAHIRGERPSWQLIDFNALERHHPTFAVLLEALAGDGFRPRPYFNTGKIYDAIAEPTWEAFLASRRGKFYKGLIRKARKLQRDWDTRLRIYRQPDELDEAIAAFRHIHARSWKEPDFFPELFPEMIRAGARAGALRLGILSLNNTPVASELWICADCRASIVNCSYDAEHSKRSPGTVLRLLMLQELIAADQLREVNLGRDDASYKLSWFYHRRELGGIAAYNTHTPRGALMLMRHDGEDKLQAVKDAVKSTLGHGPAAPAKPSAASEPGAGSD